jgi:hypothetical protein
MDECCLDVDWFMRVNMDEWLTVRYQRSSGKRAACSLQPMHSLSVICWHLINNRFQTMLQQHWAQTMTLSRSTQQVGLHDSVA